MATVLPLPDLDDRRWTDLVDEARALIPFHAPGWTDHNVHDPGITLIELFAWIAEMDLYQVNRITDAHRRKLLALAGITPAPPVPATTLLALAGGQATVLPAGVEFSGPAPEPRFRSRHAITVQPGAVAAVLGGDPARAITAAWSRAEPVLPFGDDPGQGAALYVGFDLPAPWPAGTPLSLGFVVPRAAEAAEPAHHDVVLRWEQRTAGGHWVAVDSVVDGTRALTRSGRVRVRLSTRSAASVLDPHPAARSWLRARLVRGTFDAAPAVVGPVLNAVEVDQAVPAAITVPLAPGALVTGVPPDPGTVTGLDLTPDRAGRLTRLGFTAPDGHRPAVLLLAYDGAALTIEAAAVTRSTGAASQRIDVPGAPLVTPRLWSQEGGTWRPWAIRPDLDASTRSDAHAVADLTAGTITLGDGEHGRVAPAGATLLVTADRTTGAMASADRTADSPHNRVAFPPDVVVTVSQVVPAAGGAAAETVAAAIARARDGREQALRAVTLDDYAELARQTPGARIARAAAFANTHPAFGCQRAPGVVTVLVLPYLPAGRPLPSPGLRRTVAAHLCRRRVIGTRIEVAEPRYVAVTVRAAVAALPGTPAGLAAAVREAIDGFLHPLTGGPDGTGWPFGRDVHRSEVLAVVDDVPGVDHVRALELVTADGNASCGDVCVGPTGLVNAGPHEIEVRDD